MEITYQEQMDIDFDWFCVDASGEIGHFSTAGFKNLPHSVARSAEELEYVTKYFEVESGASGTYLIDPLLEEKHRKERYLRGFVTMAAKGLYSFDIDTYLKPNINYFRVASPKKPLKLNNLPEQVRKIIGRTALNGRLFTVSSSIPYEETLVL